jgi:hypothetical protein
MLTATLAAKLVALAVHDFHADLQKFGRSAGTRAVVSNEIEH